MIFTIETGGRKFRIDADNPLDISIALEFNGAQPNAFGVEKAASKPCEAGALVGDTRLGGSCNFEQYTLIPHCNGTHTESIGHITHERISVRECLRDAFIPARLISVEPESISLTNDSYTIEIEENDRLITRRCLEKSLEKAFGNSFREESRQRKEFFQALVVRTLPNDESKLSKTYLEDVPPFFTTEAIEFITELGVRHLLVDLPSIDRIYDEGKLSNHRIFWNVEPDSFEKSGESLAENTITELIYAPDEIKDGAYLLNLQIAPFASDAAPSRPMLFEIIEFF